MTLAISSLLLLAPFPQAPAPPETPIEPCVAALDPPAEQPPNTDPTQLEAPLPSASPDWHATLVLDNEGVGVWTVDAFQVFEQYASPEVIGLDDLGRCNVMVSYSAKWTPLRRVGDGKWLGGLAHGDVDPRVEGAELYVGGQLGNLYQLRPYSHGALDARLIGHFPGLELHTLVAGELDPRTPGPELLVFTRPGALYSVHVSQETGEFESELLQELPGRVRDALVLPARGGLRGEVATVSRAGKLQLLRIGTQGPEWRTLHEGPMGQGRLALRDSLPGVPRVLYSTLDDGRVLRHEEQSSGAWQTETIYAGPQGPRGIAAGRFDPDPAVETVAVFGYSRKVQLLSRRDSGWEVETLFVDLDKGHWLAAAELDGRNGTRELIGSGYGGRVFLLSRLPGVGLEGVATEPAEAPAAPHAK
jgi:hypothetical protein